MTSWIIINTNTTISNGSKFLVDTRSGPIILEFPILPVLGDEIYIADASDWSINNLTLISPSYNFSNNETSVVLKNKSSQYQFIFDGDIWLIYNVSLATTKISDLPAAAEILVSDDDLLLYIDKDSGAYESKAITYGNLKSKITEDSYKTVQNIILDINAYSGVPQLNPKLLDGETGSYYLDYTNLTNRPVIPTVISDLTNNLGYIRNLTSFTTDDLDEGFDNKYLTQESFTNYFDTAFATSYRLYSGDFSEITITDSIDNVVGTPITSQVGTATNTIEIPSEVIDYFKVGQNLRIYGGNTINTNIAEIPVLSTVVKNGFAGITSSITTQYKIAQFDLLTGKISTSSVTSSTITNINFESFNAINNIQITFNRSNTAYGILVYRRINSGDFSLIDVLGQKELGNSLTNIVYRDYGTFNYSPWTKRNVNTGAYDNNTGTIHFPLNAPGVPLKGWVDVQITGVDTTSNRLTLNASIYYDTSVIISHNDTQRIQAAINQRVNSGINSLTLNDKQYIISKLVIPAQFSLYGKGRDTIIKKLAWSTEVDNNIIAMSSTVAKNVNLSNFNINGNMQNQWLKQDEFSEFVNFAINMKSTSETFTIDKVNIANIVAGGVFVNQPTKLLINLSRIEDSGMSDLYDYSPLLAGDGSDIIVTNNTFRNFTSAIDLSVTFNGVFASNVVENVGSGVLTFASKFFITSQNIIKGPAGEYIPGPDIFNSVYDSINITLEPGTQYMSDVYAYQENGKNFNITPESNRSVLSFSVDKLKKVDNAEQLYGQILIGGISPIQRVSDLTLKPDEGEFKFSISQANVTSLTSTYSYTTLKAADAAHVGLVYRALLTEYVPSGTVVGVPTRSGTPFTILNVTLTNYSNIYKGARVRLLGYGGTPNLDTLTGTVINTPREVLNSTDIEVDIDFGQAITLGTVNFNTKITVENTFILAKGKIL